MTGDLPKHACLWQGLFSERFEEVFLETLAAYHRQKPFESKYVLVGSNLLGIHLRRALTQKMGHTFNVKMLTFLDLAKKILEFSGETNPKKVFPKGLEEWLLEKQLAQTIFEKKGSVRMLQKHFQRLTEYQAVGQENLKKLYDLHRDGYSKTYQHPADTVEKATQVADEVFAEFFQKHSLFCYGFYDLTVLQKKLIQKCAKGAALFCFLPKSGYRHEMVENTEKFFKSICPESTLVPAAERKPIEIHAYGTLEAEAEGVAMQIQKAHTQKGVLYEDMGVVLASVKQAMIYQDILTRQGIPYFLSGGESLSQTVLGQGFLGYLELLSGKWQRRDLIEVLARLQFSSKQPQDMGTSADWDIWTQKANIVGGFQDVIDRSQRKVSDADPRQKIFFQWLLEFSLFSQQLTQDQPRWADHISLWEKWFVLFLSKNVIYEKILDVILTLGDLENSEMPPTFLNVARVLKERGVKIQKGLFKKQGVYLGTGTPVRNVCFKSLWIVGLTDDEHPKRNEVHGWFKIDDMPIDDGSFLYQLLLGQGNTVTLSYPRYGFLHQELHPSPFIKDLSKLTKTPITFHPLLSWHQEEKKIKGLYDFQSHTLSQYVAHHRGMSPEVFAEWSPLFSSVSRWVDRRLGSDFYTEYDGMVREEASELFHRKSFSPKSLGDFSTCPYQYFLRSILKLSEAELPEDTVEVKKLHRGNIVHEILFSTFTELKKKNLFPLAQMDRDLLWQMVKDKANHVIRRFEAETPYGLRPLWSLEKKWILQDVWHFMQQDMGESPYSPEAFELRFGMKATGGAEDVSYSTEKKIPLEINKNLVVEFYGKIDRVDLSADQKRIRVIDYKTGETLKAKEDSLNEGKSLQLPIYLLAAAKLFPEVNIESSEAWLMSTSLTGGFRRLQFSGLAWIAKQEAFTKLISSIVELHEGGKFIPNPGQGQENCRYCEFKPVCGASIGRIAEKKQSDIRLAQFFSLKEIGA